MEKLTHLNREELILINGGSEESYNLGYKIGNFVGSFTSNALNAMNAIVDGMKEAAEVISKIN
ncbi:hypothetical protein AAGF08_20115 [Algoriphagus sp. SE2]|uniref:hypothetical protein n=1 Tax=Algoriphagus sp. SE2 TaxID=3141536 RepID=UPI0031CD2AB2